MLRPQIAIIVLNTNHKSDTLECLATIDRNTYLNRSVIVLDNTSTDGSIEAIKTAFPWAVNVPLAKNLGYAGNNNVGIQLALQQGAEWVLVLNEDTLLDPDCLERLVAAAEADPHIGIVGPMVYHYDEPLVIQSAGGRLNRHWEASHLGQNEDDRGQFTAPHDVDYISGCAILVRRAVIQQVGLLDERFYYYWEETEWCLRARQHGWRVVHVPIAKIWHKGVQRNYHPGRSVAYYNTRNRFLMLAKHHAPARVWAHAWWQTLRTLASLSLRPKWRAERPARDAMWEGLVDFLFQRLGPMRS
jgi:GT2 family glycosyltransferase